MDFKIVQEKFHIALEDDSLSHLFRHVSEIANETKGGMYSTVWKLQNFSVTQILREIKVGES